MAEAAAVKLKTFSKKSQESGKSGRGIFGKVTVKSDAMT